MTLEEIYLGSTKKFTVKRKNLCKSCLGTGTNTGKEPEKCKHCKGRGVIQKMIQLGPGMFSQTSNHCEKCGGKGDNLSEEDTCIECKGNRICDDEHEVSVTLEKGCKTNDMLFCENEGHIVPDFEKGDIRVIIKELPDPIYKRRAYDLIRKTDIPFQNALCGGEFFLEHLGGKILKLRTEFGKIVANGEMMVIENEGLPIKSKSNQYGDLYLILNVVIPEYEILSGHIKELSKVI